MSSKFNNVSTDLQIQTKFEKTRKKLYEIDSCPNFSFIFLFRTSEQTTEAKNIYSKLSNPFINLHLKFLEFIIPIITDKLNLKNPKFLAVCQDETQTSHYFATVLT